MDTVDKLWVATKAFIEYKGNILVLRESKNYDEGTNHGAFDVVGGRLTPGEHVMDSLRREIKEETGLTVSSGDPFFVNEWRPKVRGEQWQIVGIFFRCRAKSDTVTISEDHDAYKWINPHNFSQEHIIENLFPAFEAYLKLITR